MAVGRVVSWSAFFYLSCFLAILEVELRTRIHVDSSTLCTAVSESLLNSKSWGQSAYSPTVHILNSRHFGFITRTGFSKGRTKYYSTSDATFNHDYLQLCGDVSPNPGPTAAGDSSDPRCNAARPNRISKLSCLSLNARSIVNKERELRSCLSINDYDLIAITETWLDPTINSSEIFPTSFEVFRKDRSRNGGGVLLAFNRKLLCTRRNDLETDCELLWCEVMVTNPLTNLLVGVFYRPPSTDQTYLQELEKSLALVERNGSNLTTVLLGDFNFPGIDWTLPSPSCSDSLSSYFCDIFDDYFLCQTDGKSSNPWRQYIGSCFHNQS